MSKSTVIYARVSTDDQDLDHQKDNLWQYTTEKLGVSGDEIEVLTDKSTGTNEDRSGYRRMIDLVENNEIDRVVVREVTRIGRSFRDINDTVHMIVEDHNVGLFIKNDNLEIEGGDEMSMQDKMFLSMLAWGAELEAKKIKENTKAGLKAAREAGKWTKRPPYGFTTDDDGYLQPNEDFGKAVEAIQAVDDMDWSHRKAARHTGVPRRTIPSLLDRKSMYLDEYDTSE